MSYLNFVASPLAALVLVGGANFAVSFRSPWTMELSNWLAVETVADSQRNPWAC
jgi:hypothetical protein